MRATVGDLLHTVDADDISERRILTGRILLWGAVALLAGLFVLQVLFEYGLIGWGFDNWRPVLAGYILWAIALCVSRILIYGEQGKKALFVLPAALFVISMVVFPLFFALWISFSDWNLASSTLR